MPGSCIGHASANQLLGWMNEQARPRRIDVRPGKIDDAFPVVPYRVEDAEADGSRLDRDTKALFDSLHGFARFPLQPSKPDLCAHARHQFARAERLDEVVVGAVLQPLNARLFAGARRQQNDRQLRALRILAHCAQQAESVEVRHHHVGKQ